MRTAIVSPSGKFYGSEQTLFNFLANTNNSYDVYVSKNDGSLSKHLDELGGHNIHLFNRPVLLYASLFLLFLQKKYLGLYVNEGGHIRYVKLLARFFSGRKFIVHIRINEDTSKERLKWLPPNVELISVSRYIQEQIRKTIKLETNILSSPYRKFEVTKPWRKDLIEVGKIKIGIIGRVTDNKGIDHIAKFCRYIKQHEINFLSLHFFGHVEGSKPKVKAFLEEVFVNLRNQATFHGFVKKKDEMFDNMDIIVHFNDKEPLGVIFLEALKSGVPFIGFNSGGIGDIANALKISHLMVDKTGEWCENLVSKITSIQNHSTEYKKAQEEMFKVFSIDKYCEQLEKRFR